MQLTLSEEARLDQLGVDHRVRRLLRDSLRGLNDQEIRGEGAEYSCGVAQVVEAARGARDVCRVVEEILANRTRPSSSRIPFGALRSRVASWLIPAPRATLKAWRSARPSAS